MVALLSLIQDFKLVTDSGNDVLPVVVYLASAMRLVSYAQSSIRFLHSVHAQRSLRPFPAR
ncbi:hypothetical protein C0Q70_12832 [Pomacea canaliculata]|uniref:Uncharacterized protein n=1 Tax=Pomacea canaliculata TaxID=400727 RepID=A0A2T7P2K7_POMCA|nr:hypothetical protein C0Q70_12832 [Pomacea canaliculata]